MLMNINIMTIKSIEQKKYIEQKDKSGSVKKVKKPHVRLPTISSFPL